MDKPTFRLLLVDDYEPWRQYIRSALKERQGLQIIGEASDGLEAVQMAQELQPDLILLDLGLPTLNGIEATRRIRELAPNSRILVVSEMSSRDVAEEALLRGASGYVVKSNAASDLLPAVESVLQGQRFVSASLTGLPLADPDSKQTAEHPRPDKVVELVPRQNVQIPHDHEVGFYSDDHLLLEDLTLFIGVALRARNAAIVVATQPHRDSLVRRLQAQGLDIGAAIDGGRYIALDAADALSMFMVRGMPDPVRFMKAFRNLILTAAQAAKGRPPRVAVFGEGAPLLWVQGNLEAAVRTEKLSSQLSNQLRHLSHVNVLCGYSLWSVPGAMAPHTFKRIRAEHSAVYSQ